MIPKNLVEDQPDEAKAADRAEANNYLILKIPKWKIKTVVIEVLLLAVGFFCVVAYNWLFTASIPPVLGLIVGGINGILVAWCVTATTDGHEKFLNDL